MTADKKTAKPSASKHAAGRGTYKPRSMDPTKHKDFEIAKEAMKFLPGPDEWAEKLACSRTRSSRTGARPSWTSSRS